MSKINTMSSYLTNDMVEGSTHCHGDKSGGSRVVAYCFEWTCSNWMPFV